MPEEKKIIQEGQPQKIERFFEHPPDAISFFSDYTQVISTGHEVLIQFYETIPGPPDMQSHIKQVRSRLRATITMTYPLSQNLGKLLIEKVVEGKK